jgi:hypothetical protein
MFNFAEESDVKAIGGEQGLCMQQVRARNQTRMYVQSLEALKVSRMKKERTNSDVWVFTGYCVGYNTS